ncbi:MAG: hypothetical protein IJ708_03775 [Clostridia bacterium]|nr:hypothetical protein [Clostridia bacterium]
MGKRIILLAFAVFCLFLPHALAENTVEEEFTLIDDSGEEIMDEAFDTSLAETGETDAQENQHSLTAREDFIDRIIATGESLFIKAGGHAQRAHYASDIYVCKNFTTYVFRTNRDDFRMAEYPETTLVIPDNMPKEQCKPYAYGLMWKDVTPEKGNPFYAAASFRYDTEKSAEENLALAVDFMRQIKRGDFFQMSAEYQYGVGAHSAIMIADYDPQTDTVHWMDSNMRGKKVDGIRYGIVQFNEEKPVQWWAEAFCKKKRGATIYRLRDDIVYATQE